jgi:hypothetical protein
VAALDDAVSAFNRTERIKGKTIIRVHPLQRKKESRSLSRLAGVK